MSAKDDRIAELDAECDRAHERIVELERQNRTLRAGAANLAAVNACAPAPEEKVVRDYSRYAPGRYYAVVPGQDGRVFGHHSWSKTWALHRARRDARRYARAHRGSA